MTLELKVCNCSECGREIQVAYQDGVRLKSDHVRINGRPVCVNCLPDWPVACGGGNRAGVFPSDDAGGYQSIAIRALEGD